VKSVAVFVDAVAPTVLAMPSYSHSCALLSVPLSCSVVSALHVSV
jgi:hypothetical protein